MIGDNDLKKEKIDITPDSSLLPKSGKSGYTLTQSIAELVDNSIDARVPGETLAINIVIQDEFIIIEDDASGMNKSVAERAMRLGYSEKKNALGEFGIGLKSACTSLGKSFLLKTYPIGKNEGYELSYDEDEWIAQNKGSSWNFEIGCFTKEENKHGTWIKIERLNRRVSKQRKKDVISDFSKRFAPFLVSGEVKIVVNKVECYPEEPELTEDGKTSFIINFGEGKDIHGWYGLMKKGSDKGLYGFHTFRRGRMITSYDKIGIPHHPTVSRIIGVVNLDHIPVSHNKKEFETESEEYKEAVQLLEKEFKDIVRRARQTSLSAQVTKEIKDKTEELKGRIIKAFHGEFKEILEEAKIKKKSKDDNDPIEQIIIEKRASPLHETLQKIIEKREKLRSPRDNKQIVVTHCINVSGKQYDVNHDFKPLGVDGGWKQWIPQEQTKTIEIFSNVEFPAYATSNDKAFYASISIAEALAEFVIKHEAWDMSRLQELRDSLLRNAFKEEISAKD